MVEWISSYWYVLLLLEFIILLCSFLTDSHVLAGVSVIVSILLFQFFSTLKPLEWFVLNYQTVLLGGLLYAVVGAFWSVFKWYRFVKGELYNYRLKKQEWFERRKDSEPDKCHHELQVLWKKTIPQHSGIRAYPPAPGEHKEEILKQIIYWPYSMFHAIMADAVVWVAKKIYDLFGNIYARISAYVFAEMKKDLE